MYIIYKTACVVNGKIYIGQHKIKDSKTLDPWYIGSGYPKFDNALQKYGKINFKRDIICIINKEGVYQNLTLVNSQKINIHFGVRYL